MLARHVLAYDLCADGTVVHTDGSAIYHRAADGTTTPIGEGNLIERVTVLE